MQRIIVCFSVLLAVAVVRGEERARPTVDQVLSWLPADTETIMVAKGPLQPPDHGSNGAVRVIAETYNAPPSVDPNTGERIPSRPRVRYLDERGNELAPPREPSFDQIMLRITLGTFLSPLGPRPLPEPGSEPGDHPSYEEHFQKLKLRFVVTGARNFRAVERIPSASPCEGCILAVFEQPVPAATLALLAEWAVKRSEKVGVRIWQHQLGRGDGAEQVYFAQVTDTVLAAATDLKYLEELLHRVAAPPDKLALAGSPLWKHVDRNSPAWGVHYIPNPQIKLTIGTTFHLDVEQRAVQFAFVSNSPQRVELFREACVTLLGRAVPVAASGTNGAVARLPVGNNHDLGFYTVHLMGWVIAL